MDDEQRAIMPAPEESSDQDATRRINDLLQRVEDKARLLLESFQPEELEPVQAAALAGKYITLIARLLELRQQFSTEQSSEEERLLKIIFAASSEQALK